MKIQTSAYNWVKFHSIRDFNNQDFWKTNSEAERWMGKSASKKRYPCGIYIYGFVEKINGENLFAPYYVGKSGNIFDRLYNHIAGLRGCALSIFKRNEIFSKYKDFTLNKPLNYGSLSFFNNLLDGTQSGLGKEILDEIEWMMEHWVVTWTIEPDAKKRETLEKIIGKKFDKKNLITKIGKLANEESIPDQIRIEGFDDSTENEEENDFIDDKNEYSETIKKIISELTVPLPFYEIDLSDCHVGAQKILTDFPVI